jgi:hypothetical protein
MPCRLSSLLILKPLPRSDSSRFDAINVINVVFALEESPERRERERERRSGLDEQTEDLAYEVGCLFFLRILLSLRIRILMDVVKLSGYTCRD